MDRRPVHTEWEVEFSAGDETKRIPASVPGNVGLDLLAAGIIPDPFFADNVHTLIGWEHTSWTFRTEIDIPKSKERDTILLCFEGIDTIAAISLNGETVTRTENMFVPVEVDITGLAGTRARVEVAIESCIDVAWEKTRSPKTSALPYNFASLYLRKARHSFGWDIAPRIVTAGIWKPVHIEVHAPYELTDIYIFTLRADARSAEIGIDWNCTIPPTERNCTIRFHLRDSAGETVSTSNVPVRFPTGKQTLTIANPERWWPAGYGDPVLYSLTVELVNQGSIVDSREIAFGIRTVELIRSDGVNGRRKEFRLIVNGEPIFVRGSNWVPSDAFHSRCAGKIDANLRPYIDSGCNMLRVWGGGIYEEEELFEICDRNGVMVWQDFMFACETPPRDPEYEENVRLEVESVATRYRNHASLVLWCGDNENDAVMRLWNNVPGGMNRLTRIVIPEILSEYDPHRPYLPSSPYISEEVWEASRGRKEGAIDAMIPEQHLWGPRDAFKGDFYRRNTAVFASEIGYHGSPSVQSLGKFLDSEAMDRSSAAGRKQWITHATQPYGDPSGAYAHRIGLMEQQTAMLFGNAPDTLGRFVAASQISQAEAVKYFLEHFRMRKWEKSGIIWWNMQDMWPQFSDAVIDYYGEKKLAWYYISRSQKPICIMIDEAAGWKRDIRAVNDTLESVEGTFRVHSIDGSSDAGWQPFAVGANASTSIGSVAYEDSAHRLLLIEWKSDGGNGRNHYVAGNPPWSLETYLTKWIPRILEGVRPAWVDDFLPSE